MKRTLTALLLTSAALPAPALAVDSVGCGTATGDGAPHAGRYFDVSPRASPIVGGYTYAWDQDGDGVFETSSDYSLRVLEQHAGTYRFGVRVTDSDFPVGDPRHEATGTCDVTVVNDLPENVFEAQPWDQTPVAYEALTFHYGGRDPEDSLNGKLLTQEFDFDGDGTFEYKAEGDGEVRVSFPSGWDGVVTHRVTDEAGGSVDATLPIKTRDVTGFGGSKVLVPVSSDGPLGQVTANAPKSISRKALLRGGLAATFSWGAVAARANLVPVIKKTRGQPIVTGGRYAPGERLALKPLDRGLVKLVRHGAKQIELRWTVYANSGERTGKLVVKIAK
ncbi:MAG: hypothetical protein QOF76_3034 [Solirubrobacteraceae bacterium]|nr:hypothetical protein [Solirubrobacteraceae bacterium]